VARARERRGDGGLSGSPFSMLRREFVAVVSMLMSVPEFLRRRDRRCWPTAKLSQIFPNVRRSASRGRDRACVREESPERAPFISPLPSPRYLAGTPLMAPLYISR